MKQLLIASLLALMVNPLFASDEVVECHRHYENIVKNASALLPVVSAYSSSNSSWSPISKDAFRWYGETIPLGHRERLIKRAIESEDLNHIRDTFRRVNTFNEMIESGVMMGSYLADIITLGSKEDICSNSDLQGRIARISTASHFNILNSCNNISYVFSNTLFIHDEARKEITNPMRDLTKRIREVVEPEKHEYYGCLSKGDAHLTDPNLILP